jgi:hypothetical protein
MDLETRNEWTSDLCSGNFIQGREKLRSLDNEYCCLGVLCELDARRTGNRWSDKSLRMPHPHHGYSYDGNSFELSIYLLEKYNISPGIQQHLMEMNDKGKSFIEIAQWIKENIQVD